MSELEPHATMVRTARITGMLYLIVIVCAGFAEGVVRTGLVVPGDPSATAENILAYETLFRAGFAADIVAFLADTAISVLLYVLLKPAGRTLALIAAAFRLIAHPAIGGLNLLNHYTALILLGQGGAFESGQVEVLAAAALEAHGVGYLIAGAFFGVHLALLGYLLAKSERFPSVLGVLIALAAAGYLIESFGNFMAPGHEAILAIVVAVPAAIGEIALALWLTIKGVRTPTSVAENGTST